MLLVFVPILLIGLAFTFLAPTKYAASTRLLVRLGQEYVLDPVMGEAGKGAFPQQEDVLQAETELAKSPVIAERVINGIGLPQLGHFWASFRVVFIASILSLPTSEAFWAKRYRKFANF